MKDPFAWFWIIMIMLSIAWYGILLFFVGFKGGREIIEMIKALSRNAENGKRDVASD